MDQDFLCKRTIKVASCSEHGDCNNCFLNPNIEYKNPEYRGIRMLVQQNTKRESSEANRTTGNYTDDVKQRYRHMIDVMLCGS